VSRRGFVKSLFIKNVVDLKTGWTRVWRAGLSNCMLTLLEWLGFGLGVPDECETFFLCCKKGLYIKF